MNLPRGERHDFINPDILPVIMKNVMEKHFPNENFTIYNWHYFTANNVMTGKIEITDETRTIHHFVSAWESETRRKNREREQRLHRILGTGLAWRIFDRLQGTVNRFKHRGLGKSLGYYFQRFILRKPAVPLDDT
jgi:glutamate synthase domain-containing protein 1